MWWWTIDAEEDNDGDGGEQDESIFDLAKMVLKRRCPLNKKK